MEGGSRRKGRKTIKTITKEGIAWSGIKWEEAGRKDYRIHDTEKD